MSQTPDPSGGRYEEYYAEQLKVGQEFQDFVTCVMYRLGLPIVSLGSRRSQIEMGENMAGVEIKRDGKFHDTGNLYIETHEKAHPSRPTYVPSGIYRDDNSWLYLIGDERVFYIMQKSVLKLIHQAPGPIDGWSCRRVQSPTSKGMLLPVSRATRIARVVRPDDRQLGQA